MRERRLLLNAKCHISLWETSSSNQGVLSEKSLKENLQERNPRMKTWEKLDAAGRNRQSWQPVNSFFSKEEDQDKEMYYFHLDHNKKRREVFGLVPFAHNVSRKAQQSLLQRRMWWRKDSKSEESYKKHTRDARRKSGQLHVPALMTFPVVSYRLTTLSDQQSLM